MKRLLLMGLLFFGNCEVVAQETHNVEQMSDEQAILIQYDLFVELRDYQDINSWEDLKEFFLYLNDTNEGFALLVQNVLADSDISTLDEALDFVEAFETMQDLLYRFAQTKQQLQREVYKLQDEDSFADWCRVMSDFETAVLESTLVPTTEDNVCSVEIEEKFEKILMYVFVLNNVLSDWEEQVEAGNAFYF